MLKLNFFVVKVFSLICFCVFVVKVEGIEGGVGRKCNMSYELSFEVDWL